jgi:putative membrane protein
MQPDPKACPRIRRKVKRIMFWHKILVLKVKISIMKKMYLATACVILMVSVTACNGDSGSSSSTTDNTSTTTSDSNNSNNGAMNNNAATENNANSATISTANKLPLSKDDSLFVMKAAIGGMLEVQSGTTAQQNGVNERVKGFGTMLVNDHTKANTELMAIVSGRGMTPPADLPADKKKHVQDMAKMKGKAFDNHFISMMNMDHKKDIELFEKQANSGTDPELKAFAAKTLPVLKMHLDTAQALSKMKM